MEVFYIANAVIPSSRAHTVNIMHMCGGFAAAGFKTTLITSRRRDVATDDDPWHFYGLPGNFEIIRLPVFSHAGIPSLFSYRALRRVRRDNSLLITRHLTIAARAVRKNQPTVFECHRSRYNSEDCLTELIRSDVFRMVLITDALRDEWTARLGPGAARKMLVAPDAVLPERYAPAPAEPAAGGELKVGYAGSLAQGKGMELIIRLAALCRDMKCSFHVLGGQDDEISTWKKQAAAAGNLHFRGYLPYYQVPSFLMEMDVLLLPNRTEVYSPGSTADIGRWTSPLKMFEYMAAAKPVVASDLPVLREVLRHDENALLVPPDDQARWRSALETLAGDPQLRMRLGSCARRDVENRYTWEIRARKIAALF